MKEEVSEALLAQLTEFLSTHTGLHFPKQRWPDLRRGITNTVKELGFEDAELWIKELLTESVSQKQIEVLSSYLTIGETYFFRDPNSFELLQKHVLPEIIRSRQDKERYLRIWSAGCCTGEEPYSMAILISKMIPDLKSWQVTIHGTDINSNFLRKASQGIYSEWSFRGTDKRFKESFFEKQTDGRYKIIPSIQEMVSFSYLNLAKDVFPSLLNNTNAMDIILCRNVLMYLTSEQSLKVIDKLCRSLVEKGWLLVSASEVPQVNISNFARISFSGTTIYKKENTLLSSSPTLLSSDEASANIASPSYVLPPPPLHTEATLSLNHKEIVDDLSSKIEPAKNCTESVIEKLSDPARESIFKEVVALYEQGQYSQAAAKLTALHSTNQDQDPQSMSLMAKIMANQGKLSEALLWCDQAIAAEKLNAGYQYLRATILQEKGQVGEAMSALRKALYLDPNFILAHFTLSNLARKQGELKLAAKHTDNTILLLAGHNREDILPESEGITAGRLLAIIHSTSDRGDH